MRLMPEQMPEGQHHAERQNGAWKVKAARKVLAYIIVEVREIYDMRLSWARILMVSMN